MVKRELDAVVEAVIDYCNGTEAQLVKLRKQLETLSNKEMKTVIAESIFSNLNWKDEEGARIGEYQISVDNQNVPQKWNHAYNILKANGAVIGKRFHEESYQFSYWLYDQMPYKIFRKKLKESSS